jgi:hypothetical protein
MDRSPARTYRPSPVITADRAALARSAEARKAREAAANAAQFTKAHRVDGVWRWNSNNACPFDDMMEAWEAAGLVTAAERKATDAARKADTTRTLAQYRKARANGPSAHERAAARAAHGPGVKLVDVITGQSWTT